MKLLVNHEEGVDVGGVGFGTRLTFQGFKLVASGFYNHGLGMQFQGNVGGAILDLLMKEVKLDTSMVVTSKVLMTLVKVQTLVTHMVLTI